MYIWLNEKEIQGILKYMKQNFCFKKKSYVIAAIQVFINIIHIV